MTNKIVLTIFITLITAVCASTASAQSLLNRMRVGNCLDLNSDEARRIRQQHNRTEMTPQELYDRLVSLERRRGLVLDVRPFAINQASGKLSFNGPNGHVAVVNMNPFVYSYDISVAQQELVTEAVSDFLEFLLPPSLIPGGKAESGRADNTIATNATIENRLKLIAERLNDFNETKCPNKDDAGCQALVTLKSVFGKLQKQFAEIKPFEAPDEFKRYKSDLLEVRNKEADAYATCVAAEGMRDRLDTFFRSKDALKRLKEADEKLRVAEWIAQDLAELTAEYGRDSEIQNYNVRCGGFKCLKQFSDYASRAEAFLVTLRAELTSHQQTAEQMESTLEATNEMARKEGLFARSFDIIKRFEFSEATISIDRRDRADSRSENVAAGGQPESGTPGTIPKPVKTSGSGTSTGAGNGGGPKEEAVKENGAEPENKEGSNDGNASNNGGGNGSNALNAEVNQSIQVGRPRFLLSGGLVYSPMKRRNFQPVTGFARDANGNPTGDGTDNVIGLEEDSPRRLLPMVNLNTRLHSFSPTTVYFSLGVTAKHDSNVDIEYLLGPSVSLLNERAVFTFGGYLGRVQNLVPDVKLGDKIPDNIGDAKLFTKRYSFKPGFSFSWVFSENTRQGDSLTTSGSGSSSANRPELKNEIRIGGLRFNLAMGLVYSSLEDQTYDEIVGFARDRQGNLTSGQDLTRVVGLVSDSGYRVIPMVMLHSRLLDFGSSRSLYFTTGVSGRKTDNSIKIEYLLGPSINLYGRKLFLTFGAFAGKQQLLGGDFFPGAALESSQNVTLHDRYVWKPAFGFSYDMTKIFRRGSN